MHYIRLLRPPTIDKSNPNDPVLSLLLTITTDLGESFLHPDGPIELTFFANSSGPAKPPITGGCYLKPVDPVRPVRWEPGMRVLNAKLRFVKAHLYADSSSVRMRARQTDPGTALSLGETRDLLPWRLEEDGRRSEGLIADLTVEFGAGAVFSASLREFTCQHEPGESDGVFLQIEEDIGESIARHIWDAGLVTAGLLADACRFAEGEVHVRDLLPLPKAKEDLNVLEIGCGVGILGIAIAGVVHRAATMGHETRSARPYVLLTDLPEAEERARANIARFRNYTAGTSNIPRAEVEYENLDWDEGQASRFGPIVGSRRWDLVVLSDCTYNVDAFPQLVGTLNSLHSLNAARAEPGAQASFTTRVLMSTKPRHDSERALFGLLESEGWTYQLKKAIPLPKLDSEPELVEVYLIEKKAPSTPSSRKRKGSNASPTDKPSKKSTSTVSGQETPRSTHPTS